MSGSVGGAKAKAASGHSRMDRIGVGPVDATFLSGANAVFVAELYAGYLKNPASVDPSWASFFADLGDNEPDLLKELAGASWAPSDAAIVGVSEAPAALAKGKTAPSAPSADSAA